jgi:hypothetical protein
MNARQLAVKSLFRASDLIIKLAGVLDEAALSLMRQEDFQTEPEPIPDAEDAHTDDCPVPPFDPSLPPSTNSSNYQEQSTEQSNEGK